MLDIIRSRLTAYSPGELKLPYPQAGILLPVTASANPSLLFTRRADHLAKHAGQVAFPGGKKEIQDESLTVTALRESEEEIGLDPKSVEVVGSLNDVVSRYNILVRPFVGIVPDKPSLRPDPNEIADIFEVPLSYFLKGEPDRIDDLSGPGYHLLAPRWEYLGFTIWGMSSVVMMNFLETVFDHKVGEFQRLDFEPKVEMP